MPRCTGKKFIVTGATLHIAPDEAQFDGAVSVIAENR